MGPNCDILIKSDDESTLAELDSLLVSVADSLIKTRKGRVWDIYLSERPIHVSIQASIINLSAGCNDALDYTMIRKLAAMIVEKFGGFATQVEK